jgi:hypothetical protein
MGWSGAHVPRMDTIVKCDCGAEYKRTEAKFLMPHTGHVSCEVCGAVLESWLESTHFATFELVKRPDRKLSAPTPGGFVLRVRAMVIIQQQGGFRTSYDPETGKLVRIELWERPEKRPQYSLETWPDAESAEKAFWARDIKWQK